jgi:hypothetical protein
MKGSRDRALGARAQSGGDDQEGTANMAPHLPPAYWYHGSPRQERENISKLSDRMQFAKYSQRTFRNNLSISFSPPFSRPILPVTDSW